MSRQILVSLLKTVVFLDVVKIITTNHNRSLHFHLLNNSRQDTASDADIASERAFLVNVVSIDCLDKKDRTQDLNTSQS
jgi:hypothetical protein